MQSGTLRSKSIFMIKEQCSCDKQCLWIFKQTTNMNLHLTHIFCVVFAMTAEYCFLSINFSTFCLGVKWLLGLGLIMPSWSFCGKQGQLQLGYFGYFDHLKGSFLLLFIKRRKRPLVGVLGCLLQQQKGEKGPGSSGIFRSPLQWGASALPALPCNLQEWGVLVAKWLPS